MRLDEIALQPVFDKKAILAELANQCRRNC